MDMIERTKARILAYLSRYSRIPELLAYVKEPLVEVEKALREMEKEGLIEIRGDRIIKLVETKEGILDYRCRLCKGRGVEIPVEWLEEFKKIAKNRPRARREFDQGYVTPESAVARVVFMGNNGDLKNKEILILGDDDLVSIAIAITGLAKRIVVLEVDKRLNDFIRQVSAEHGFDIEVFDFNLLEPLPDEFEQAFDVFETDPPETLAGIRSFVGRGIWALKRFGAGYFGLTRIESSLEKWLKFEKMLVDEFGVVITDILQHFSFYEPWEYEVKLPVPKEVWYNSSFVRIEKLRGSRGYNERVAEDILRDEETLTL